MPPQACCYPGSNKSRAARTPMAIARVMGRVRGPPARHSQWRDRARGQHQPVVGGQDDLGGGAHGAPPGEVAAEAAALVVSHGQVQVGAVLRQGAGEGGDLEGPARWRARRRRRAAAWPATGCRRRSAPSPPGSVRARRAPVRLVVVPEGYWHLALHGPRVGASALRRPSARAVVSACIAGAASAPGVGLVGHRLAVGSRSA
jgi:hypothetical protein